MNKNEVNFHSAILGLARKYRKNIREKASKLGLTEGQPKLLRFLSSNPGCSQRELATLCHIEPATATSILSNMENNEFIVRSRNEKDKRILNVHLTPKGEEVRRMIQKYQLEIDEKCLEGFSNEEIANLMNYIERISNNLDKGEETIE